MLLAAHILTGATLGIAIHNPAFSAPIAFATHILLDAVPHWNYPIPTERSLRGFWRAFGPDMLASIIILLLLILWFKQQWLLIIWGVGWAALPDFLTLFQNQKPWSRRLKGYFKLHNLAQWEVSKGPGLAIQAFYTFILVIILIALR